MDDACCGGTGGCSDNVTSCSGSEDHGCHGCHSQENIDVPSLGPEAVELANLFEEVNQNLLAALKSRRKILDMLYQKSNQSNRMKETMEKVVRSRHPVLRQFVLGE